jgi:hypothetical protein
MVLDKGLLTMGILWVGTARKYKANCANHSPFSGFNFEAEIRFSKDKTASAEEVYSVKRDSRQL